jgi:hypothetical protein
MEVKCATSFDERFDPNNVLNKYTYSYLYTLILGTLESFGSQLGSIHKNYSLIWAVQSQSTKSNSWQLEVSYSFKISTYKDF